MPPLQNGGNLNALGATVSIDATSLRTTIKSNDNTNINLDFGNPVNPHAPPMRTLGWLLGFRIENMKVILNILAKALLIWLVVNISFLY